MYRFILASVLSAACAIGASTGFAQSDQARSLVSWLDLPANWSRGVENNVVAAMPEDLPPGASLLLLIEPPIPAEGTLEADYEQALADLGPWQPVFPPQQQSFDNGWVFQQGVGVTQLEGVVYTGLTVVARLGALRARFWVLADSDDTYNRYQPVFLNAISSVQDFTHPPASGPSAAAPPVKNPPIQQGPRATPTLEQAQLPVGFGKGVSGVYVGIERGLSASAGVGAGQQQVFNPSTGQYETSNTGTAPQVVTQVSDYAEVDVFFPDGTYRRRLPIRGLYTNLGWEKTQQLPLWGTWTREGDKITVRRNRGKYEGGGTYTAIYTLKNGELISSRGRPWTKLPMQRGVRLDGTYARHDVRRPDAPRLVLKPDGTFREIDSFLDMVGSPWHMVEPDADGMTGKLSDDQLKRVMAGGSGTYSFDDFTLTFKTNDGRIWQINAYIPAGDSPPRPKRLVINGYQLLAD